jgi:Zn-dependent protease
MPSLRFSRVGRNLYCLQDISLADIFIQMVVLLFSLTVHEMAHAWSADQFGDPTARRQGRISLNPVVHADPIGTVLFPLISMVSGAPLIGWAKPVPVDLRYLRHPRRDYMLVAAAGPASNLVLALFAALLLVLVPVSPQTLDQTNVSVPVAAFLSKLITLNVLLAVFNMIPIPPLDGGNVLAGLLPPALADIFNRMRPYGFLLLYALLLSGAFYYIVGPPYTFILSLLPTR